jgi:hypothetical protein
MNKKIRISIEIDEILRNKWTQFDRMYVQEFGEEGVPEEEYVFDYFNKYKWESGVESVNILKDDAPEDISPKDYQINDDGTSAADPFLFKTESKEFTAEEQYNRFMYEDFVFEIFGSAPQMYRGLDLHLNEFINKFKDFEITIVSKENLHSIPPTLFFLSKSMIRFKNYKFYDEYYEFWDDCDVLITTNPELLKNKPDDKMVIKLKRPYNNDIECEHEFIQLIDLVKDKEIIKKIEENGK